MEQHVNICNKEGQIPQDPGLYILMQSGHRTQHIVMGKHMESTGPWLAKGIIVLTQFRFISSSDTNKLQAVKMGTEIFIKIISLACLSLRFK